MGGHEAAPSGARGGEARDVVGVGEHAGQYLKEDVVGQSGQVGVVVVATVSASPAGVGRHSQQMRAGSS